MIDDIINSMREKQQENEIDDTIQHIEGDQ